MKNIKINKSDNRILVKGNKYLYLGFNQWNYDDIIKINPDRKFKKKIHIFITRITDLNEYLIKSLCFIANNFENYKVIFHTPYECKDIQKVLVKKIIPELVVDHKLKYDTYIEKNGPKFLISEKLGYELVVNYNGDHVQTSINLLYTYTDALCIDDETWNPARKEYPELFKDELIADFKRYYPQFAESFDNDDDIWDYMMGTGEWVGKPKVDAKATLIIPESFNKEEAEDYVRTKIQKVFKGVD